MAYNPTIWINDDGTGTVGTPATANSFNNMEQGILNNSEQINALKLTEYDLTPYLVNGFTGRASFFYNSEILVLQACIKRDTDSGTYQTIMSGYNESFLPDYSIRELYSNMGILRMVGARHTGTSFIDTNTTSYKANQTLYIFSIFKY